MIRIAQFPGPILHGFQPARRRRHGPHAWLLAGLWTIFLSAVATGQTVNGRPTSTAEQARPKLDRNELLFVADVLVNEEYSEKDKGRVVRWSKAPRLSVFGTEDRHEAVVNRVIQEINNVLPVESKIEHLKDDDTSADIRLYFIKADAFSDTAEAHDFQIVSGNQGFFNLVWNSRYEIEKAQVLIAEDKLSGRRLTHFVLEELTQSLGPMGDSSRIKRSVFYENAMLGHYGKTTRLTPIDQKLIRFLYTHVEPGAWPIELGVQIERHWK